MVSRTSIDTAATLRQADRRDVLRTAGARIFANRGYHGASMQDVAQAIGFTKASIYYYYAGKEDLLFDILSFADREVTALFVAQEARACDPLEQVGQIVALHVSWYLRHPAIAKLAFRDWTCLTGDRLSLQAERRRKHSQFLRRAVTRCRDAGLIASETDIGLVCNFINGAVAASNMWFRPEGAAHPAAVGRAFGEMAIATVAGFGSRRKSKGSMS